MKLIKRITRFFSISYRTNKYAQRVRYQSHHDRLIDKALNCDKPGVQKEQICGHEIIVSLTTYGRRIHDVATTIESIMQGSYLPNRIVLWLGENMRDVALPIALQRQQKRGLEIAFCEDLGAAKKLIPTLRKYPDAAVITIDDDVIYNYDMVEKLVNAHHRHSKDVIANVVSRIGLKSNRSIQRYRRWRNVAEADNVSHLNFAKGCGGVLYPPHAFDNDVLDEKTLMQLCRTTDDVWFYVMELKAGTKVRKSFTRHYAYGYEFIDNENVQEEALNRKNNRHISKGLCQNDFNLVNLLDHYNLWDKLRA